MSTTGCTDEIPPDSPAADGGAGRDPRWSRFGVRIPALLISPRIAAGTVFRASAGTIDHTSVLKTLEERWGLRGRYPEAAEGAHDDQGEIRDLGKRSGNQRPFTSPKSQPIETSPRFCRGEEAGLRLSLVSQPAVVGVDTGAAAGWAATAPARARCRASSLVWSREVRSTVPPTP